MTIYTPSVPEKKPDKEDGPEVVTEPLTSFKDEEDEYEVPAKFMRVTYFPLKRRTFCIHLLLTIMVLVILACGAIGAVVFYRHLHKKQTYSGTCGNVYFDASYHDQPEGLRAEGSPRGQPELDYFEERIEVSLDDMYESLYTPQFDEVRETYVWHDFQKNYTALIEHRWRMCYVMKLNRTRIAPPKDLIDLMNKVMTGYYLPKANVLRENYRMVVPALTDLSQFGLGISNKCKFYDTFWLMKVTEDKRKKRETNKDAVYAVLSNHYENQNIIKMNIHIQGVENVE